MHRHGVTELVLPAAMVQAGQHTENGLGLSHEHLSHEHVRREDGERRCPLPRSPEWRQSIPHTEHPDHRLANSVVAHRDPELAVRDAFSRLRELRRVRGRRHALCRRVLALDLPNLLNGSDDIHPRRVGPVARFCPALPTRPTRRPFASANHGHLQAERTRFTGRVHTPLVRALPCCGLTPR